MNKKEGDILRLLTEERNATQRILSEISGYSLGNVNAIVQTLVEKNYINEDLVVTENGLCELQRTSPHNAVILAAGYGMRMVPINLEKPKGLLEARGEVLIERLIRQLHDAGIHEIYIVVGFMKECYEYLIDKFNVQLIVNEKYAAKNNLYSLYRAEKHLTNSYVIPCDIWCERNPFSKREAYSWYMVCTKADKNSSIRINKKNELVKVSGNTGGNQMVGIAYLTGETTQYVKGRMEIFQSDAKYDNCFWEEALFRDNKMSAYANIVNDTDVTEINTYEQLREFDHNSDHLKSDAIAVIEEVFGINAGEITNIEVLKKGMTNRSFIFECRAENYIMRIPGEGTEELINRQDEAEVYSVINGTGICDDNIYLNPQNGYKITRFIKNSRTCDPLEEEDVKKCMARLREFHEKRIIVSHTFDLFNQIEKYEKLRGKEKSFYKDYLETREKIFSLREYIDKNKCPYVLTHIDAVPDNFLFDLEKGQEKLYLIDWEYAGMQDPHVDIAMFCIYAMYDRKRIDQTIDFYFGEKADRNVRTKIYCYIAVCGLLWSNWCEYKRTLGVEFGEYSLRQYRYAKEYYEIVMSERKGNSVE